MADLLDGTVLRGDVLLSRGGVDIRRHRQCPLKLPDLPPDDGPAALRAGLGLPPPYDCLSPQLAQRPRDTAHARRALPAATGTGDVHGRLRSIFLSGCPAVADQGDGQCAGDILPDTDTSRGVRAVAASEPDGDGAADAAGHRQPLHDEVPWGAFNGGGHPQCRHRQRCDQRL